jgi:hypothetical protein
MIEEIWKSVVNYENLYEVSNYGKIKSFKYGKEKILKPRKNRSGHLTVVLHKNGTPNYCYIHRLVLETFVGPCPSGMESCHNDGNPPNNFIGNLRWDTRKANQGDKILHGTDQKGSNNNHSVLIEEKVMDIKRDLANGLSYAKIAKKYNVSKSAIAHINKGRSWEHIK